MVISKRNKLWKLMLNGLLKKEGLICRSCTYVPSKLNQNKSLRWGSVLRFLGILELSQYLYYDYCYFLKYLKDMGLVAFHLMFSLLYEIFKIISVYLNLEITGSGSGDETKKTGGIYWETTKACWYTCFVVKNFVIRKFRMLRIYVFFFYNLTQHKKFQITKNVKKPQEHVIIWYIYLLIRKWSC